MKDERNGIIKSHDVIYKWNVKIYNDDNGDDDVCVCLFIDIVMSPCTLVSIFS